VNQFPVKKARKENQHVAGAILDRIVYSSHRIQLKGESLRKNKFAIAGLS